MPAPPLTANSVAESTEKLSGVQLEIVGEDEHVWLGLPGMGMLTLVLPFGVWMPPTLTTP